MVELPEAARRHLRRMTSRGDHPDTGVLTAFVEGTLAKSHRQDLFNHLAACSECNRVLALIAPELEVNPVVQPIAAPRGWFAWRSLRWAGAAVVAAMVVSAVWVGRLEPPATRPAATSAAVQQAPPVIANAQVTPPNSVEPSPSRRASSRPSAPESRELAKAAPTVVPPGLAQFDPAIAAQSRPAVPGATRGENAFQTSVMSSAPPAPPPAPAPDAVPAMKAPEPAVPAAPTGPIWSVSDAGALQRSTDGGHHWTAWPVPNRAPLRVVSVMDQEIWVGGDNGGLYHSADAGRTWVAVVASGNGQALTGDISRIAFSDFRHGWVVTRDGQIWTTPDAGATWYLKSKP